MGRHSTRATALAALLMCSSVWAVFLPLQARPDSTENAPTSRDSCLWWVLKNLPSQLANCNRADVGVVTPGDPSWKALTGIAAWMTPAAPRAGVYFDTPTGDGTCDNNFYGLCRDTCIPTGARNMWLKACSVGDAPQFKVMATATIYPEQNAPGCVPDLADATNVGASNTTESARAPTLWSTRTHSAFRPNKIVSPDNLEVGTPGSTPADAFELHPYLQSAPGDWIDVKPTAEVFFNAADTLTVDVECTVQSRGQATAMYLCKAEETVCSVYNLGSDVFPRGIATITGKKLEAGEYKVYLVSVGATMDDPEPSAGARVMCSILPQ